MAQVRDIEENLTENVKYGFGFLLAFLAISSFSLTLPITASLTPFLSVSEISIGRNVLPAFVAIFMLVVTRQPLPSLSTLKKLIVSTAGVVFGFPAFIGIGTLTVPSSHGAVILGMLPFTTALFGFILSKKRPPMQFWFISLLGLVAVVTYTLLTTRGALNIGFYGGDIALVIAVILGSLGYAQGGILARSMGGWRVICWSLAISAPILFILAIFTFNTQDFMAMNTGAWLGLCFLAFVNSFFGFFIWYHAMALCGVAYAAQVQYLQPFMTALFSFLLFGEKITYTTIIFMLIIFSIILVGRKYSTKGII